MGGRGASSGKYKWKDAWHTYGDEYKTVYQYRNIKFVKPKEGSATAPMETKTQGRVYVTLGSNGKPKYISYYAGSGNRRKQIDLSGPSHKVNDEILNPPHTHNGFVHSEFGTHKQNKREQNMIDRVLRIWNNHKSKD